jgi:glycosyltransferase involved in cell wall biosynthesis
MTKLSIITINLNNFTGLRKTIESVINQTYNNLEYIIIDGGSSDGSVELIKEYKEKLAYWISEPDGGIYSAMNKGIKHAKGEYCLFLNSGDILAKYDILEECFNKCFSEDITYCNIIFEDRNVLKQRNFPQELTFYHFFVDSIGHPSSFIKRGLFDKIGLYNEKLRINSDWEFFLKAIFLYNCSLNYLDEYLVIFNNLGISGNSYELHQYERLLVLEELFPRFLPDYIKLKLFSEYTQIHTGNKFIRKLATYINQVLDFRHNRKSLITSSDSKKALS